MTIFLSILAIPLGILVFLAILFVIAIIVSHPGETVGILLLIVIGYSIGTAILGIDNILFA